jgi:tRNA uridine 5-carboxymethylaminomethyl modification enzyme
MDLVRSIKGFENAHITRPGYAIEYDYFNPQDLKFTLETKSIAGLFFAGQINGTTGYEEAGAQGMLAGINASLLADEKDPWSPRRDEAYLGVLVDDLITMGTKEPYRMFTSRAEYRLLLREDNADLRLTEQGRNLGLVDDERWEMFSEKRESIELEKQRLKETWIQAGSAEAKIVEEKTASPLNREYSLLDLLKRPEFVYKDVASLKGEAVANDQVAEQVEISAKYAGYIDRQRDEIERMRVHEHTEIPAEFDFSNIEGLSNEVKQKLSEARPETLARASRIQGVTPAAVSLLLVYLKKRGLLKKKMASAS